MRAVAYLFIVLGFVFLADAAYDQHRGVAEALSPGRGSRLNVARRSDDPKGFQNLMAYQWLRALAALLGGSIFLGICQRADRSDPFHPDFASTPAFDALDHTLSQEAKNRQHPIE